MDEPDIEVRYGAFNALRTLDPHDPFLGLVRVLDEPKARRTRTTRPTRWRSRSRLRPDAVAPPDDPFALYVVDSEGPRLSTCRGPAGPRSSSSAGSRSCCRRLSWTPARSCSTPPRTTTRSSSARSSQPVRRCRHQDHDFAGPGRGHPQDGQPGGDLPRDRRDPGSRQAAEEPARPARRRRRARLQPRRTSRPSWARTQPPSETTP